jgi:hypothetical protein
MECAKARGERTDLGDTPPHAGVRSGLGGVAAGRGEAGAAAPRGRETGRGHPGVSPAAHADEAAAPPRRQVCAGIGGSGRRGGRSGHGDRAGTRHGRRQTGSGALAAAAASATQKASRQATGSLGIALRYPDFWDRHHATQHDALDEFRFLYKGIQTTRSDTNSRKRNNQLYSISSQQMFHSTKQKLA